MLPMTIPVPTIADLPLLNAALNGLATALLAAGYLAIRRRRIGVHRFLMLAAFTTSAFFLVSYVIYHANVGSRRFAGTGAVRPLYLALLVTHVVLAAAMVPPILMTLARALRGRFSDHARIARRTLPVWIYVSITGVAIYLMLYRL